MIFWLVSTTDFSARFLSLSAWKRADQFGHEASSSEGEKESQAEKGWGHRQPARQIQTPRFDGGTYEGSTRRANPCFRSCGPIYQPV